MVVKGDISELFALSDSISPVQVVQDQPKFEWASLMLFNCNSCMNLTPEFVEDPKNQMFDLAWARGKVGSLPKEWNKCVGYTDPGEAKLYHYTQGLPCFPETAGIEDGPWIEEAKRMRYSVSWNELMGSSVHAKAVRARLAA